MSFLDDAFKGLYTQFILHDIMGKIIPGSLVLLAGCFFFYSSLGEVFRDAKNVPFALWLVGIGLAWLVGFGLQSARNDMGRGQVDESTTRYRHRIKFYQLAGPYEYQQLKRFWLVRDATGNGSNSLFVVAILLAAKLVVMWVAGELNLSLAAIVLLAAGLGLALRKISNSYDEKRSIFMKTTISLHQEKET